MEEKKSATETRLKENKPSKKLNESDKLVDEYRETLQRLQADFENYRKRVEKDIATYKVYTNAELIKRMLPVLDSFELAIKNSNAGGEKFRKGIELVYAQLYSALEAEGLKAISAVGEKFDPYRHEALMQQDAGEEMVVEEFQKGYMLKDAVIRHSKVKVGKKGQNVDIIKNTEGRSAEACKD